MLINSKIVYIFLLVLSNLRHFHTMVRQLELPFVPFTQSQILQVKISLR